MARRKKPQTDPVFDNSSPEADGRADASRVLTCLDDSSVSSVLRFIQTSPLEEVLQLRQKTHETLKRLGVSRNLSAAYSGPAEGRITVGTIYRWLDSIQPEDAASIDQLVLIDATCVARGT